MTSSAHTNQYCRDLAAGLADGGMQAVFVSPGSRNTTLILAFLAEPRIKVISVRDERSAAFAALGYGKSTGTPAGALCTSGTAGAHYFPAVIEASHAHVPLIALTADRPTRLRGSTAPQTTDQRNFYGTFVHSYSDLDVTSDDGREQGHTLAHRAQTSPAGPVHINVPLDEPFLSDPIPEEPSTTPSLVADISPISVGGAENAFGRLEGKNVLIVASGQQDQGFVDAAQAVSLALNAPILADTQCWVGGHNSVAHHDLLARVDGLVESHKPDVVLRLGSLPTSQSLRNWLESTDVEQLLVSQSTLTDVISSRATTIDADPTVFLRAMPEMTLDDSSFLESWLAMGEQAGVAVEHAASNLPFPSEPAVARYLTADIETGSTLYLSSSMPIRDVNSFASPRSDVRVLSNRGVNGIDGVISSALGAALSGEKVTLLVGDIAALHDATALAEVARLRATLRIVVVNNDGGGIFSFLPQATTETVDHSIFESYFGTPHGLSLVDMAQAVGLEARVVTTLDDYRRAVASPIEQPELIELFTNRVTNVTHHASISDAVRDAVSSA